MQRRSFLKTTASAGLLTLITPTGIIEAFSRLITSGLEKDFVTPPNSAMPQTWWHWMNGNVTKEGITLDLEAMKSIGLGGFQNFDAGTGIPKGPIVYLSPEWLELKVHAINEARRLGLEFTMHNCPGWSSSGGPWITPELSMQQLTWSETYIKGGKTVLKQLAKPLTRLNYYNDVVVLAYPSLKNENLLQSRLSKASDGKGVVDINSAEGIVPHSEDAKSNYLLFELNEANTVSYVSFIAASLHNGNSGGATGGFGPGPQITLESSDDGIQFHPVKRVSPVVSGSEAMFEASFTGVKSKYFRLSGSQPMNYKQLNLSAVPRNADWLRKANFTFSGLKPSVSAVGAALPEHIIDIKSIVDVTSMMDKNGVLKWAAPEGEWTVLRFGYTSLGILNRSAPDTGIGLDCDKYNPLAIEFHFKKMMENLLPALGPSAAEGKVGLLIDSYELGMQNWSPKFPDEFSKQNNYELIKYLPAMTGRIVVDADHTERFLWDIRRTQANLMADNYYGKFNELCHNSKIIAYMEPYDRGPMEEMQIGSRVDIPMGEFWNGLSTLFPDNYTMRRTTKLAASIAHINGKKIVAAESFTSEPESARWQEYPFAMKGLGDKMFTEGLNRLIFHRFAHQPHATALPGMTMGPWGIHFDRTTTWWNQGNEWIKYLGRCQSMLQQGNFVADLLYHTGDEVDVYTKVEKRELNPIPPEGYDYDLINAETAIEQIKIENGNIVLSSGMRYKVFVLQNPDAINLPLLGKLAELVNNGMILVGAKPQRSVGMRAYAYDVEFKRLTSILWGDIASGTAIENKLGKGIVFWGQPLQEILNKVNVKPDFGFSSVSGDAPLMYIHRRTEQEDIYFISNQRRTGEHLVCNFRVDQKQPEIWDPATGNITPLTLYEVLNGQVRLPLFLEPYGSAFIVFRSKASGRSIHTITRNNTALLSTKPIPASPRTLYKDITNNFTISYWAKPEINIMTAASTFGSIPPWTDFYSIFPPPGNDLYGHGHSTCGLTVGRNGIVVWEYAANPPKMVLVAKTPISGWSHISLVYQDGVPSVYVNGKLIQKGTKTTNTIHPGIGQAYLTEAASFYNGDMTTPAIVSRTLNGNELLALAAKDRPVTRETSAVEFLPDGQSEVVIWQDGSYSLVDDHGKSAALHISIPFKPVDLSTQWNVRFPSDTGAPEAIALPKLISLHQHEQDGVKHFSGTCTYYKDITLPSLPAAGKSNKKGKLFLDLGQVEVIAQVTVNGKDLGILWKRPYRVDITDVAKTGTNKIEIRVTNLWPNRLIGDEQFPDENKFTPGSGGSGFQSLSGGAIEQLPDWYMQGKPKPKTDRVTFTTWKHYKKEDPLLESGLIGPVKLHFGYAVRMDVL